MNESSQIIIAPPQGLYHAQLPVKSEMTFRDLFTVVSRRRGIAIAAAVFVVALGITMFVTSARLYKATAVVQVQKESVDALSLDNMISQPAAEQGALESNLTVQTEARVLQSEALALKVIKALNLENTPDFQPRFSLAGWIFGRLSSVGSQETADPSLGDARRQNRAVNIFKSRLKVKPLPGTRLITVEYLSSDPRTAAAVVNLLVNDLTEFNFETRHGATQLATEWLSKQMTDLRKQSEDLESKVAELQKDSGVFTLGQTDSQGRDQVYTPTLDTLQKATADLADAQSARILKGALYQAVKRGDPELISSLAGNSTLAGSSPGISNSLALLQTLRSQEAQTQAQLDQLSDKFGPAYPRLTEVKASLAATQRAIAAESARIAARVKNDYQVAKHVEDNDRAVFDQTKRQAEVLNDKAVEYQMVRQEAQQSRNLYQTLFSRLKEADLVAGLRSSNITVVDPARIPVRPAKPNILFYFPGTLAVAVMLAICAALLRDATDLSIQEMSELTSFGRATPLGVLPYHPGRTARKYLRISNRPSLAFSVSWIDPKDLIVAAAEPRSTYTEALRAVRTALMRTNQGGRPPQVVVITSSTPGEGKSMLSINLAAVYAQHGKKVLLVDADLRTPILHRRLSLPLERGLSDLLTRASVEGDPVAPINVPLDGNSILDILPAGPAPKYPAELLGSEAMREAIERWRKNYDYIFIDGAPLLPVTDSALLASYADFTLVVARHKLTDRRSLEKTFHILQLDGVRNIGLVLNAVKVSGAAQYRYYGYRPMAYQGDAYVS